jgi:uncharacterized membrane protein HdeD (DUF308 family)
MPIVMNPRHVSYHERTERTAPQKVVITLGLTFLVIGLVGVMVPGLLGMHLSVAHNLVHLVSGLIAIWCGFANNNRAVNFCIGFGAVYGLLGIAGFVLGEPGYPAFGHMEADQNLFRAIPNVLELGTMDHLVHLFIGTFLVFTAYTYRKEKRRL